MPVLLLQCGGALSKARPKVVVWLSGYKDTVPVGAALTPLLGLDGLILPSSLAFGLRFLFVCHDGVRTEPGVKIKRGVWDLELTRGSRGRWPLQWFNGM